MNRKRLTTAVLMVSGIGALVASMTVHSTYRLLYNPSDSAPKGWYLVIPAKAVRVDNYVVARLPDEFAQMASLRGYLPSTVPLLKHVAAVRGQHACHRDGSLHLDRHRIAEVRTMDGSGRQLSAWRGCRYLAKDELLLLSTDSDASFDSRYFGPITMSNVIGQAIPIYVW